MRKDLKSRMSNDRLQKWKDRQQAVTDLIASLSKERAEYEAYLSRKEKLLLTELDRIQAICTKIQVSPSESVRDDNRSLKSYRFDLIERLDRNESAGTCLQRRLLAYVESTTESLERVEDSLKLLLLERNKMKEDLDRLTSEETKQNDSVLQEAKRHTNVLYEGLRQEWIQFRSDLAKETRTKVASRRRRSSGFRRFLPF